MEISWLTALWRAQQFLIYRLLHYALLCCLVYGAQALATTGKGATPSLPHAFAPDSAVNPASVMALTTISTRRSSTRRSDPVHSFWQRKPAAAVNNPFSAAPHIPGTIDGKLSEKMSRLSLSVTESRKHSQIRNSAPPELSKLSNVFDFIEEGEEEPPEGIEGMPNVLEMDISFIGESRNEEQCFKVLQENTMESALPRSSNRQYTTTVEPVQCQVSSATGDSEAVYGEHSVAITPTAVSTFRGDRPPSQRNNQLFQEQGAYVGTGYGNQSESTYIQSQGYVASANYSTLSYRSQIVVALPSTPLKNPSHQGKESIPPDTKPNLMHDNNVLDDRAIPKPAPAPDYDNGAIYNADIIKKDSGYNKLTYPVLVGNTVKVYGTRIFAALPSQSKFMVKERQKDASGVTRVKLALKNSNDDQETVQPEATNLPGSADQPELYTTGKGQYFRENTKTPGRIIYTCDERFHGTIKYPLPTGKATDSKIGKGGNGFVFTIYHERKQYAVKKTVYRSNEVNVHAALRHENILPLLSVLMGERHERHSGRFYCFHFMPKMDYDLRQVMNTREVGCLKHFYNHCSKDSEKWQTGFNNIKFILAKTLDALTYIHDNGYVHRDVKASNIMIKMLCQCQPLSCGCSSKFQVKLGDFDSAGTVPGLGIKEPADQMIKFASILPLGTPGYRAPEVAMHITLSGPYETLYTFAVDMWSFGCLALNIAIGKTAALKQREEASLLLSKTHPCGQELWEKTTKIKELEATKPFSDDKDFTNLVRDCLQVDPEKRPSAAKARSLPLFPQ